MKIIFILLISILLSACSERWEKPGATQEDFKQVQSGCVYHAAELYPPVLHKILREGAYATPSHAGCFGSPNLLDCMNSQSVFMGPTYETVDDNQKSRDDFVQSCLRKNGWKQVDE